MYGLPTRVRCDKCLGRCINPEGVYECLDCGYACCAYVVGSNALTEDKIYLSAHGLATESVDI